MPFATIFFYVITYFRIDKIIFKCYNNFATYLRISYIWRAIWKEITEKKSTK